VDTKNGESPAQATDERLPSHRLPDFARLGRPNKQLAVAEGDAPHDEDLADLVCSVGWLKFLSIVKKEGIGIHRALIQRTVPAGNEGALAAGLALLMKVLSPAYEKAGYPIPEYLKMLLSGELPE